MNVRFPRYYYSILLLVTVIYTIFEGFSFLSTVNKSAPEIKNGVVEFRASDFDKNQIIPLRGESEFYWKKLLSPSDFQETRELQPEYIHVPGQWNDFQLKDVHLGSQGFATYRIIIRVPDNGWYGLKIKEFDSSYRIWMNNEQVNAGKTSTSKKGYIPSWKRNELYASAINNSLEIIIQLANFDHRKGGAEDLLFFGKAQSIQKLKLRNISTEMFILGILAITFFYYLGLYFFRIKDSNFVVFALFILVIAIRLLLTGEKQLLTVFPQLEWYTALRLEYMTIALAPGLGLILTLKVYPDNKLKIVRLVNYILVGLYVLLVLVLPPKIFTYFTIYYQPVIWITFLLLIRILIKAIRAKDRAAYFMLIGISFVVITGINEFLYYNNLIQTGYLLPFALVVLIFSFSYGMSVKFAVTMDERNNLRIELENYNKILENKVSERTRELTEKQIILLQQSNELKNTNEQLGELVTFRDNMIGLIIHDMKALLAPVLNLEEDSSRESIKLSKQSGIILYNLVLNILELQKNDAAKLELNKKPTSLYNILIEVSDQLAYLIKARSIIMQNMLSPNQVIECDEHLMKRIFLNIIHNAIKYSPKGGRINVYSEEKNQATKIFISDEGPGIPAGFKKVIFERYGQVTNSLKDKVSTGLGLAFCKMAVTLHGGKIGVESKPDQGSIFWFILPNK